MSGFVALYSYFVALHSVISIVLRGAVGSTWINYMTCLCMHFQTEIFLINLSEFCGVVLAEATSMPNKVLSDISV